MCRVESYGTLSPDDRSRSRRTAGHGARHQPAHSEYRLDLRDARGGHAHRLAVVRATGPHAGSRGTRCVRADPPLAEPRHERRAPGFRAGERGLCRPGASQPRGSRMAIGGGRARDWRNRRGGRDGVCPRRRAGVRGADNGPAGARAAPTRDDPRTSRGRVLGRHHPRNESNPARERGRARNESDLAPRPGRLRLGARPRRHRSGLDRCGRMHRHGGRPGHRAWFGQSVVHADMGFDPVATRRGLRAGRARRHRRGLSELPRRRIHRCGVAPG